MITTVNPVSDFLVNNNLHLQPIGARIGMYALDVSDWCTKGTKSNTWDGKLAIVISKAVLISGSVGAAVISTIECLAMAAIGGVGLLFCFALPAKCEFFEKHTLKTLSYAANSGIAALTCTLLAVKGNGLPFHIGNAFAYHTMHIGSALLVQLTIGKFFDQRRGLADAQIATSSGYRMVGLFADAAPDLLGDGARSLVRDLYNPAFRSSAASMIQTGIQWVATNFPHGTAGLQNIVRTGNNGAMSINLHGSPSLDQYQTHLQALTKAAYLEICRDDALAAAFKDPEPSTPVPQEQEAQSGRDALASVEAHVFPLLAKWTQLKELEGEIRCPENFQGFQLNMFNTRQALLVQTKQRYEALDNDQKTMLKRRLLGLEQQGNDPAVQAVFTDIALLVDPLLQGRLVTRMILNIGQGTVEGNGAINIFQTAMREAQAQWEAEHPAPPAANA